MPLSRISLTAPITASQLTFGVSSTTPFPPVGTLFINQPVWVQDELMFCVGVPAVNTITVRSRGSDGQAATAHDVGSLCVTSATPGDFPPLAPGQSVLQPASVEDVGTYGADGAIAIPIEDTKAAITKASAAALTLAAPFLAPNGIRLSITSLTAAAHAITTAALLRNGAAGGPFNTVTFPAQFGASIILEAWDGLWNVIASNGAMVYT